MELARLGCSTPWFTQNSHITKPHTTPANIRKPYFFSGRSCPLSSSSPYEGKYLLYTISTNAMVILLRRYRFIWQLMGVLRPNTAAPTTHPATKLLKGRYPNNFFSSKQQILQNSTKVPSLRPCSNAFLKIDLIVLELKFLKRNVITSECTKRTRVPYSRPFRSPFSTGSHSPKLNDIIYSLQLIFLYYLIPCFHTRDTSVLPICSIQVHLDITHILHQGQQLGPDIITMKNLISNITKRLIFPFSQQPEKNIKQYLRNKKTQELTKDIGKKQTDIDTLNHSHRLLYVQFIPSILVAIPAFYFFNTPVDPGYLQGCNILQYYTSGLLCFNAFFTQQNKQKYCLFLLGVAGANCLSGPLSIASPVLLGLLNIYFPFTHEKLHKSESAQQTQNMKTHVSIQAIYYFIVVVLITLKCNHFLSIKELQTKLKNYERENRQHYAKLTSQPSTST